MKGTLILAAAVAASLSLAGAVPADDDDQGRDRRENDFKARLAGANEVPVILTAAKATLKLKIDDAAQSIAFTLTFQDLSANLAAAHIHIAQRNVNGGVAAFFCGGDAQPACPAATSGTITGTITSANVVAIAGQGLNAGDFAALVGAIRSGNTYANMHDARFPGGEIRGQIFED